ncbi:hypothetical protein Tdes44962_MAKER04910 [Teratosphaeria destructans]|uniref:Uncharacterized protein n=1 Tax=Teratosphaeria destructans TaxID=418781 RepID=A0A9W7VZG1_9PEZI|nr:hypothetical protein Tdes44962_MAKER04910 [Teratosphaeria destructans]
MPTLSALPTELKLEIAERVKDLPGLLALSRVDSVVQDYIKNHADRLILGCCDAQPKDQLKGNIVAELLGPMLPSLSELRQADSNIRRESLVLSQAMYDAEDRWDDRCSSSILLRPFSALNKFQNIVKDVENLVQACCDYLVVENLANKFAELFESSLMLEDEPVKRSRIRKAIWSLRLFLRCTLEPALEQYEQIEMGAKGRSRGHEKAILAERTERLIHIWLMSPRDDELEDMHEVFLALLSLAEQEKVGEAAIHQSTMLANLLRLKQVLALWHISLPHWFQVDVKMVREQGAWSFWKAQAKAEELSSKQVLGVVELRTKRYRGIGVTRP